MKICIISVNVKLRKSLNVVESERSTTLRKPSIVTYVSRKENKDNALNNLQALLN